LIPDAGHSPYFEEAATFNGWWRRSCRSSAEEETLSQDNPRIAVLGFAIECNRFSPVSTAEDFETDVDIRGNRIVTEARAGPRSPCPTCPASSPRWTAPALDAGAAARLAGQPAAGRGDFFKGFLAEIEAGLKSRCRSTACSSSCHGAALAEGTDDPDGDLFEMVAASSGRTCRWSRLRPARQRLAQHDRQLSVFVGYLENPHNDIYERGVEAAKHMRECLAGARTAVTMVKVPLVPPQISLLTAQGPLRRPDQVRPDQGGRRHPERLGDGGLRLQRQPQERPHRRGDGAQRQPPGGGQPVARHRQARLGMKSVSSGR
jgi:hypothetical protein